MITLYTAKQRRLEVITCASPLRDVTHSYKAFFGPDTVYLCILLNGTTYIYGAVKNF